MHNYFGHPLPNLYNNEFIYVLLEEILKNTDNKGRIGNQYKIEDDKFEKLKELI